jgi:hypothetical protein
MSEPFNAPELMALLRGLEQRGVLCEIKHRRVTSDCDGIVVRFSSASKIWEVGFYDYGHMEISKYDLSGNAQGGVTATSVLSEWDAS